METVETVETVEVKTVKKAETRGPTLNLEHTQPLYTSEKNRRTLAIELHTGSCVRQNQAWFCADPCLVG